MDLSHKTSLIDTEDRLNEKDSHAAAYVIKPVQCSSAMGVPSNEALRQAIATNKTCARRNSGMTNRCRFMHV